MPYGAGADTITAVPTAKFTQNAALFDQMTAKLHSTPDVFSAPGGGATDTYELLKSGILVWATLQFEGTLTTVKGTGTVTTKWPWPYGFVSLAKFAANVSASMINATGVDLHVHRFLTNPSFIDGLDEYPGTIGGGDTIADGTYDFNLTWDVPIVMDMVTLAGCIYAQSNQNSLTLSITQETTANLLALTGTATATFAGSFTWSIDSYEIPTHPEQGIVTPDLSRSHLFQKFDQSFVATGDNPVYLTQVDGQLCRLLVQVRNSSTEVLSPLFGGGFDTLSLVYGTNQEPLDYSVPDLVALNNKQYGAPLPYGYVALDFVRTNPVRDAVYMPGLTEVRVVPNIDSSVTVGAGANIHTVQEMLVSAQG